MVAATGSPTLNRLLDGGYPEGRTTLLVGTPGAGKSTLAMQFLQAGLDEGDSCLYVSTEQPREEIEQAFASFEFELDHDRLDITSIHARTGQSFESDTPELVIETLDDGDTVVSSVPIPFTSDRIRQVLERYADADRVVLDSVSGLRPMATDDDVYRRGVLDLIQLFSGQFGATTLFTAEGNSGRANARSVEKVGTDSTVQYSVYGIVRLWRELVRGSYRRFLDVPKMRGVNHDTRRFELVFDEGGVSVLPRNRTIPLTVVAHPRLSTGLDVLDDVLGGGIPCGGGTLLEHDGQADIRQLLFTISTAALEQEFSIGLVPRVNTQPRVIDTMFERRGQSREALMEENRTFVVDPVGSWPDRPNVFDIEESGEHIESAVERITERHGGEGLFLILNTEALVHTLDVETVREFRYWLESNVLDDETALLDVHNPNVMGDEMADFFIDAASMVLETWRETTGLQYLKCRKGDDADIGRVKLFDHTEEPPYIRLS